MKQPAVLARERTAGHTHTFSTRPRIRARRALRAGTQRMLAMALAWLALMTLVIHMQPALDGMTMSWCGFWLHHLGLGAQASMQVVSIAGREIMLPALEMADVGVGRWALAGHIAALAMLASLARRLALRRPSIAWVLGVVCVVHGLGVAAVTLHGGAVTSVSAHTQALSLATRVLLWLMPAILVCSLYVLEPRWSRRLLGCALVLGYLAVALPIKLVAHAWLIELATPLVMPALFLLAGPALDVAACAGILAWLLSLPPEKAGRTG